MELILYILLAFLFGFLSAILICTKIVDCVFKKLKDENSIEINKSLQKLNSNIL